MTTPRLKNDATHLSEVHYPIDDDEPLAESEYQLFPLTYAHGALTGWYENDPTVWVGADMFLYYEEGVPSSVVAPDVFVVTQTHKRHRRNIFQTWVEGRVPDLVLEVMSSTSVRRDTVAKYELYQNLGVREYWIYDPTEEGFIEPRLRGYMLVDGGYEAIEVREMEGRLVGVSEALGLELHADAEWFRFFDPESGEYLPDTYETRHALEESERELTSERHAREEAERGRASERRAREELENLLREHGIEPPPRTGGSG